MKPNQSPYFSTKNFILLCLIFFNIATYAQQEVFISGQVIDSETKEGLEYCSISFYNTKEELITGTTSNSKGYFESSLKKGKYKMVLDFMGYENKKIDIFITKNNQFLGTYQLALDTKTLNSVNIKASTKSFKIDKNVYTVTKKMKVAAANTNDVLDKINGVTYDRYNNNIKVDGQKNVILLVNGLEKDAEYIQNLNPDRLKKVEIIKDPSGKYGLEGYAAVINVILKQNYKGMELSIYDQTIFDSDSKNTKYMLPINNLSLGYNYTYNRVNLYSKYSHQLNNLNFPTYILKNYNNGDRIDKTLPNDTENLTKNTLNDNVTFGIDYYMNPRHTVSFETGFSNLFANKGETYIDYQFNEYHNNNLINSSLLTQKSDNKSNSNYQSVFYIAKYNDRNQLNLDATLSSYKDESKSTFLENNTLDRIDNADNKQNKFRLNGEFTHSINEKSNINLGYGFYWKKNDNQFNSTGFILKDKRHKLFGYYAIKPSKKVSVKAGISGEISTPEAFDKKITYFIYQPYLDVKYNLSKKVDLKLKYRSKSNYPSLSEANPNTIYLDEQTVSTGNPYLKPSVTHKLSVRSNIMRGFLSVEPYFHFSNNYIGQIGNLRDDGIIEYTYDNVGNYKHYGIKGSIAFPLFKNVFWQTNADFYQSSILYKEKNNTINDYNLSSNLLYINQKKALTTGFIFQRGMNKYISTQGYNKWNNDFLGFLVQKGFYKNKLNIMALYMLPIDLGLQYKQKEYVETPTFNSLTVYDITLLKNVFVFKLTYRFNKGKSTRKTEKDIDNSNDKKKKGLF